MKTDTIAAIASAMTNAGIGVIRISGEHAIETADRIFKGKDKKILAEAESHTIHYGAVFDGSEKIDEVIVLLMRGPRSYTREDTVEIDCHGGVYVMKRILETVIRNGARLAEPGEFTKRAFLNGRIDLSQAESVMDLIQSKNEFARKSSLNQLSGAVSSAVKNIRAGLLYEIAFIESALDDPEHISLEGYPQKLKNKIALLSEEIDSLLRGSENGRLLKEGISTVIVGRPNVGKSSLLNALLNEERAIVTDIAGTTRDVLEEQIQLNGICLNITDTAGIHDTDDVVERIGVEKARTCLRKADLVLFVVNASEKLNENDDEILKSLERRHVIVLLNKSDLDTVTTIEDLKERTKESQTFRYLSISAKERSGMSELEEMIRELFFSGQIDLNDEVFITNLRHKAALQEAKQSLQFVLQSIEDGMPEDFYSVDLMNAYEELGKILGEAVEDDLVNEIFRKFCTGK